MIQRVSQASVTSTLNETTTTAQIPGGLLALVGFEKTDTEAEAEAAARQLLKLRLFPCDGSAKATLNLKDAGKELLLVSQFTLSAALKSGRPSFHKAMPGTPARELWEGFIACCRAEGVPVQSGVFGAFMQVHSVNDGPFTLCLQAADGKCEAW